MILVVSLPDRARPNISIPSDPRSIREHCVATSVYIIRVHPMRDSDLLDYILDRISKVALATRTKVLSIRRRGKIHGYI
jgi:hypothetical protein